VNEAAGVDVVTFGCRLNLVESEAMRRAAAGQRDLTIVNTCAVTGEAVRQARQQIRRLKRTAPSRKIVVTGCAATVDPAAFAGMAEVERVVANDDKTDPASWAAVPKATGPTPLRLAAGVEDHTRAFLAIQTGCDHRCTFCIIPYGRGASRSVPVAEICETAARLSAEGFHEIVLTGVDLTSYGADLPGGGTLGALVKAILRAGPALPRLRLSSIDCIEADPDLVEAIADDPRVMPHLHLSLQSGDDLILKRMKRRHSRAEAVDFCARLRAARPDLVFGADLIAGFPTETEAAFENTLALLDDCGLTHVHVFPFSPRPGTPAARMPPVEPSIVRARAARLREAAGVALNRHLAAQIGCVRPVLMERGGIGRLPDFSRIRVPDMTPGTLADVRVLGREGALLSGQLAG
jgi:threonylcarbamoyladenosine tRNA methylthiotransferase MtaB